MNSGERSAATASRTLDQAFFACSSAVLVALVHCPGMLAAGRESLHHESEISFPEIVQAFAGPA